MKKMKKMVGLLLTVVMVLSMTMTAFADGVEETFSLTIKNASTGHTYTAYQIFDGDAKVNTADKVLSNITWGTGITTAGQNAYGDPVAKAKAIGTTAADADAFARDLVAKNYLATGHTGEFVGENYVIDNLEAGYYLVVDSTAPSTDGMLSKYIVKVVGDTEAEPKVSKVPGFEKKVDDVNDSTGETGLLQDSADHDIGDKVNFTLTATLPEGYEKYVDYYLAFNDDMSDGLTLDKGSFVVTVDGKTLAANEYAISYPNADDADDFKLVIYDVKTVAPDAKTGDTVVVTYKAELNENAVIGKPGNPNTANLEYSRNPNWDGDGNTEPGDSDKDKTPDDVVVVFTYETIIDKVDQNGDALGGAEFTLEKKVKVKNEETGEMEDSWVAVEQVETTPGTTFTFKGLDDGEYRLTETKTPAGYNSIDPINFTVTATHTVAETADKVITIETLTVTPENLFKASVSGGTIEKTKGEKTLTTGQIYTEIVNQAGATLPETGGMGTTLFYVFGTILVVGAAVMLITKKRMSGVR